jgi:hypothetical protein
MRRLVTAALAAAALATSACQQQNFFGPRVNVRTAYLTLYAATGSPTFYPSAIEIAGTTVNEARADVNLNGTAFFDVVVDLDLSAPGTPRIKLIPLRAWVLAPTLNFPSVGIRASTDAFDTANTAPNEGYVSDTAVVVNPKQTVYLQTNRCQGFQQNQFSKVIVDSVDVAQRLLFLRLATDPNCGQRTFGTSNFPPR